MELVDFLRARLDEDEAAAKAATPGPWTVDNQTYAETISTPDGTAVIGGGRWGGEASVFESTEDAVHIARHDPARVLADVEAKRAVVDFADTYEGSFHASQFLPKLAAVYRDHPDFDPAWMED